LHPCEEKPASKHYNLLKWGAAALRPYMTMIVMLFCLASGERRINRD
jgi:hypothetical protein